MERAWIRSYSYAFGEGAMPHSRAGRNLQSGVMVLLSSRQSDSRPITHRVVIGCHYAFEACIGVQQKWDDQDTGFLPLANDDRTFLITRVQGRSLLNGICGEPARDDCCYIRKSTHAICHSPIPSET